MQNTIQAQSGIITSQRNRGSCLAAVVIAGVILLLIGLIVVLSLVGGYNKAIRLDQEAEKAFADIDVQLQRRFDLIPNLVETVRGYATHESDLFNNIAQARTEYFNADNRGEQIQAAGELEGFLSRLIMLQENYPDLKANQNFLTLQAQLEGTENRIGVARTRYNQAVTTLNTYCRSFFGRFFCNWAGVEPAELFEITDEQTRENPQVNFGTNTTTPATEAPAAAETEPATE
ncbi:MAG: LemA family protein [Sedimentisphaerales bacterium]|nr:LemA family protein [Sedimentisphaerales bacterium]